MSCSNTIPNDPSPAPASSRLGDTSDVLSQIFSYLPKSTLFATLQVSKSFFHASAPHLYHTLTIKSGVGNIFQGSTRLDNLTFDRKVTSDGTEASNEIHKNSLLKYIKRIDIYVHTINECQFVRQYIEPLPNLEVLHLAKGKRNGDDGEGRFSELNEEENVCYNEKCQFITKVCINAKKVIIRDLNSSPLAGYKKVENVVLKIRACELPFYMGEGMSNFRNQQHSNDEDGHSPKIPEYSEGWFRKTKLPSSVKRLDIVWWDENHRYRLDSYESTFNGFGAWGRGNQDRKIIMKGCKYCDQQGCVRYSPHVGLQLPTLFKMLGRDSKNLIRVGVWNFERTCGGNQWQGYILSYEELKEKLVESFRIGRKERNSTTPQPIDLNNDLELENDDGIQDKSHITFNSGLEYYTYGKQQNEIDEEEMEYWKDRFNPPPKLEQLRESVWNAMTEEELGLTREDIDFWSEESCLNFLVSREEKRKRREEERMKVDRIDEEDEGNYSDGSSILE